MSINLLDTDTKSVRAAIVHDTTVLLNKIGRCLETHFSARKNFSIVDLWSIRNRKSHYSIYRNRLDL